MAFPFLFRPALLLPPPGFAKLRLYPCSSRQSVSTPYYIYKFSECRAAAIALESDFIPKMPKKGHSIDNLLKGFSLYDEICSELAKDKELVQILRSVITDSCYPDLALKTLTIDFCFYIGSLYAKKSVKENEWFPVEYNPNISTEKWLELLADKNVFNEKSLAIMKRIKDYGGEATCKQLAAKYGLHFSKNYGLEINWKIKKELRKVAHKHLFNYYKKLDKNYLTLDDLNSLPQGYAVTAKDVAALSGQNIVKGIHPIKAFMRTVGLMNMRQF